MNTNHKIHTFKDETSFKKEITKSFNTLNPKNLAASGGSSANIFDYNLDIKYTNIFIVDERFVPSSNQNSNYNLLHSKIKDKANLISWEVEKFDTPKQCATNYEQKLPQVFDLIILGVGEDGHTASLFPNDKKALNENTKSCIHTQTGIHQTKDRVTFTFPTILKSKKIFIILMGENKKEILKKILNSNDFNQYPIIKILKQSTPEIFFLDN